MEETPKVRTKKEQCAEALFNIPTNYIGSGMIKWILSHLPDENKKGEFNASASIASAPGPELKFINSKDAGLHGAFNLTDDQMVGIRNKIEAAFGEDKDEGLPRVLIVEKIYPQLCDAEKAFLVALGIEPFGPYYQHHEMKKNGGNSLDGLIDILKKLKDKYEKGKGEDEGGSDDDDI